MNESDIQSLIRIAASEHGWRLFRNNVGVATSESGRPVRYGLANDSKQLNTQIKSSDLIGIRPVVITADMVGQTIGQFVSLEVKRSDWKYTGTDREQAQDAWIDLINRLGGYARFVTGVEDL